MRLQQISLHLYITTITVSRHFADFGDARRLLSTCVCCCLLEFWQHSWLRCLMALSSCGSQVVFLKRFSNVCVQRAHVTGCSLCPHKHSFCLLYTFPFLFLSLR